MKSWLRWFFFTLMVLTLATSRAQAGETTPTPLSFLQAQGTLIVNEQQQPVVLHGINLGSWLLIEPWINQWAMRDNSDRITEKDIWDTCRRRFGNEKTLELIRIYRDNFITEDDIRYIKSLGLNMVRVPIWWRGLAEPEYGGSEGMERLSRLVQWCKKYGVYCLLDLHGAPGGQNDDTVILGERRKNEFWSIPENQQRAEKLWVEIALRFKDEPAVVGYDILNEAWGAPDIKKLAQAYNLLYQSIRRVDPRHMIFMEDALQGLGRLPHPQTMGWTNIVYSVHSYPSSMADTDRFVKSDFPNLKRAQKYFNVPLHIGEFNSIQLDRGGAEYLKKFMNIFSYYGWAWNVWTYKKVENNLDVNWGLLTFNPGNQAPLDFNKITFDEAKRTFLSYRTIFQPDVMMESAFKTTAVAPIRSLPLASGQPGWNLTAENATLIRDADGSLQVEWQYQPANLGFWKLGDSAAWEFQAPAPGCLQLAMEYSSQANGSQMELWIDNLLYATVKIQSTGDWSQYHTMDLGRVVLSAGAHRIKLTAASDPGQGFLNLRQLSLKPAGNAKPTLKPVQSQILLSPFEVTSLVRETSICVEWQNNPPNLGYWSKGDTAAWDFQVLQAGKYQVHMNYSTPYSDARLKLQLNGQTAVEQGVPATGEWHGYRQLDLGVVDLKAGTNQIMLEFDTKPGQDAGNYRSLLLEKL